MEGKNLYQRLKEAGCELDSWQSDLHVKSTPEAREVIAQFEAEGGITNKEGFTSQIDGARWIDLPFAYQPWWDAKVGVAEESPAPKP